MAHIVKFTRLLGDVLLRSIDLYGRQQIEVGYSGHSF
jgi:hypothetical protein